MKRVEAIIQADKLTSVVDSLKAAGVGGTTIIQSRGVGSGQRPVMQGSRGTAKYEAEYNTLNTIITIVDDSKVGDVVSAIIDAAHTGNRGDGKIFITNVEEAFDIATKESGRNII
ncbi:P-II family nitrogen regulator [Candidatus Nitrosotenuis chungbukensis]|uniref:P-II family nitrogen regulator n=1 Tax=Candidatus Nitrosotenuis chungbukensis TaxID=1353246 RepID=UPI0005B2D617|nr:P-II family nitrogen regulator [Candidatus Nitrosotenuis chungbukensis]